MKKTSPEKSLVDQDREASPSTRLRQILGVGAREWLAMDQLAREFSFPSGEAARQWVKRHNVPYLTRGRRLLVDRRDMLAACDRLRRA